jgi:hypothetical protein
MVCRLKILLQNLYAYFNKSLWRDTWNAINLIISWKLKNLWFIEKCQNKVDFALELAIMIIEYCNVLLKVVVNSITTTLSRSILHCYMWHWGFYELVVTTLGLGLWQRLAQHEKRNWLKLMPSHLLIQTHFDKCWKYAQ